MSVVGPLLSDMSTKWDMGLSPSWHAVRSLRQLRNTWLQMQFEKQHLVTAKGLIDVGVIKRTAWKTASDPTCHPEGGT